MTNIDTKIKFECPETLKEAGYGIQIPDPMARQNALRKEAKLLGEISSKEQKINQYEALVNEWKEYPTTRFLEEQYTVTIDSRPDEDDDWSTWMNYGVSEDTFVRKEKRHPKFGKMPIWSPAAEKLRREKIQAKRAEIKEEKEAIPVIVEQILATKVDCWKKMADVVSKYDPDELGKLLLGEEAWAFIIDIATIANVIIQDGEVCCGARRGDRSPLSATFKWKELPEAKEGLEQMLLQDELEEAKKEKFRQQNRQRMAAIDAAIEKEKAEKAEKEQLKEAEKDRKAQLRAARKPILRK